MFFYVHQSHRHDSTQPSLFTSWVALSELLYAHMTLAIAEHGRLQSQILAAASVA